MYDIFLSFRGTDLELARAIDERLRADGLRVWFYPRSSPTGGRFTDEINQALEASEKVLVVFTPQYSADSAITKAEFDYALVHEKLLILRFEDAKLPPLAETLSYQDCKHAPDEEGFAEVVCSTARSVPVCPRQDSKRIDLQLLDRWLTGTTFVGRQKELDQINAAFNDPKCAVVCVIAGGGFGKSSLVKAWLTREEYAVKKRLSAGYSYAFSSQGADNSTPSSARFFEEAFGYFQGGGRVEADAEKRRRKLLDFLKNTRTLLVLDGLEPHQRRADEPQAGRIIDSDLEQFVGGLIERAGKSTTVITSRIMPANLVEHVNSGRVQVIVPPDPAKCAALGPVLSIDLGKLDRKSSIEILRSACRTRNAAELDALAEECEDHPLLLSLVGPAVEEGHYDLEQLRKHRDPGEANEKLSFTDTVRLLIESQLKHLGPEARALLYSVCLFDEPIEGEKLRHLLLDRASIPDFTEPLRDKHGFSDTRFRQGAQKLEAAAILVPEKREVNGVALQEPSTWTFGVHPVIQVGIRATLQKDLQSSYCKANATIYRALVRSVKKWQPSDKEEVRRLYAAIPHGVRAGRGSWTGWMYGLRCLRGYRAYSTNKLGMIGEDVEAMSHFFNGRWLEVKEDIGLRSFDKCMAYSWAGLVLIGTNQLDLGVEKMKKGMELADKAGAYVAESRTARHLAFICALLGRREESLQLAQHAVDLLGRRRPFLMWLIDLPLVVMAYQRMSAHANRGCVLHYAGKLDEAEAMFRKAEDIQAVAKPRFPKLRAIWGYRYADLLIDLGRFAEADERFLSGLVDPDKLKGWGEGVVAAPLLMLGFVRSKIRQADHLGEKRDWDKVRTFEAELQAFGRAEDGPDDAAAAPFDAIEKRKRKKPRGKKKQEYKMRLDVLTPAFRSGLAGVARLSGDPAGALREIEEAERSARVAGTVLFNLEIAVERARIHLSMGARDQALAVLLKAREEYPEVAYRRGELESLLSGLQADGRDLSSA